MQKVKKKSKSDLLISLFNIQWLVLRISVEKDSTLKLSKLNKLYEKRKVPNVYTKIACLQGIKQLIYRNIEECISSQLIQFLTGLCDHDKIRDLAIKTCYEVLIQLYLIKQGL